MLQVRASSSLASARLPDAVQAKLVVGRTDDPLEGEADRVADQVMNPSESELQCKPAVGYPHDPLEQEADQLSERVMTAADPALKMGGAGRGASSGPGGREARPVVDDVLGSLGRPLDPAVRRPMESGFGFDFSRVRIHTDTRAALSAQSLNARAYTVGDHIVFGDAQYEPTQSSGGRLLAHELAHVVQQSAGAAPRIARQANPGARARPTPVDTAFEAVKHPSQSIFNQAAGELLSLPMEDLLAAAAELRARGGLDAFISLIRIYEAAQMVWVSARLPAAMYAVKWSHSDAGKTDSAELRVVAEIFARLDPGELGIILNYLSENHPNAAKVLAMAEGQAALGEEKTGPEMTATTHVLQGAGMGSRAMPPSIGPGKWNLPGDQDPAFYIGSEAHIAIALVYDEAHPGDITFYNTREMATILRSAQRMGQVKNPDELTDKQMGLKPDITNLSKHHLYEIKPVDQQGLGRTQMMLYLSLFNAAGVPMTPGPTTEDGTMGAIPAPDGVFLFLSPEPGVIIYRYRKGSLVPELVYDEVKATEPASERWRYVLKPQEKAAIATVTVGTGMVLILMIIFAPVGA